MGCFSNLKKAKNKPNPIAPNPSAILKRVLINPVDSNTSAISTPLPIKTHCTMVKGPIITAIFNSCGIMCTFIIEHPPYLKSSSAASYIEIDKIPPFKLKKEEVTTSSFVLDLALIIFWWIRFSVFRYFFRIFGILFWIYLLLCFNFAIVLPFFRFFGFIFWLYILLCFSFAIVLPFFVNL